MIKIENSKADPFDYAQGALGTSSGVETPFDCAQGTVPVVERSRDIDYAQPPSKWSSRDIRTSSGVEMEYIK